MGELFGYRIVLIVKAGGVGEFLDIVFLAGEKVPALDGALALVLFDVVGFFGGGQLPGLVRIEADGDDVEIGSEIE